MTDYCTKNLDEAEFNAVMLACGLCVEDEDGNVLPADSSVLIDRIGPITKIDCSVDPPVEVTYPEYYANVRLLMEPTEEQAAALTAISIDPSQPQYRVWA